MPKIKHWPVVLGAALIVGVAAFAKASHHSDTHASLTGVATLPGATTGGLIEVASEAGMSVAQPSPIAIIGGDGTGGYMTPGGGGIVPVDGATTEPGTVIIGGAPPSIVPATPVEPTNPPAPDTTIIGGEPEGTIVPPTPVEPTNPPAPGTTIIGGEPEGTIVDVPVPQELTPEGMGLGTGTPYIPGFTPHAPVNDPDPIPTI